MSVIPDLRRRLLAQLHIAKKQLALDEETWRAMLWTVARVKSSAELDPAGLQRVRDHLVARGARLGYPKRPRVAADRQRQIAKIEALLADAGRPWDYALSVLRAVTRDLDAPIERLEFAPSWVLQRVIAALAIDANRKKAARAALRDPESEATP